MSISCVVFRPFDSYEEALDRASELWGIEPEYWDIFGRHHPTTRDVKKAMLASFGVDIRSRESLDRAYEERLWKTWGRALPPTLVLGENDASEVDLYLAEVRPNEQACLEIRWEDGHRDSVKLIPHDLPTTGTAELYGKTIVRKRAVLPAPIRLGYHTIVFSRQDQGPGDHAQCRLIVGPDRAYCPPSLCGEDRRAAGITVSLYGLRSARNWGCGDTTDLKTAIDWTAQEIRGSFLGLNPLHAIHNRTPYNTSPYLPNCTFYRNFIYIDPEQVVDFRNCRPAQEMFGSEKFQEQLRCLRDAEFVEYERVSRLKLRFLKLLFRTFLREYRASTSRSQAFQRWVEEEGDRLHLFAVYSALDEVLHKRDNNVWLWTEWPEEYRDPDSDSVREFSRKHWRLVLFYKYMQWVLDLQLAGAQSHAIDLGLPIGLYHDLALATDRFGSDLWAHRRYYVHGCRVGSPPDDFSPNGQDWSFPPPNTEQQREDGYSYFIDTIRKSCRHGGALRIDHVMRFFRLFWIPEGLDAAHGAYVRDNPHDLLRILALESARLKVVVVGEDLGTVEPSFRETLSKFGILSYRLLYFEKRPDGSFRLPSEYPRQALVSVTTHDLPTIAGFWTGADIESRRAAGTIDENGYHWQMADRVKEKQKLLDTLLSLGLLPDGYPRSAAALPVLTGELHNAIIGFLAGTPSLLLALNQEDLTKETAQQNLPGTTAEYPNWRRKMRYALEELSSLQVPRDCSAMLRHWLSCTDRIMSHG